MTNFNFEPDDNNWDSSPNETSWSESQWRHYLRGTDKDSARFLSIYNSIKDKPNHLDEAASLMGWDNEDISLTDDINVSLDEEDASLDASNSPYTLHKHPVYVVTKALYSYLNHSWEHFIKDESAAIKPSECWALSKSLHLGEINILLSIQALDLGDYGLAICHIKNSLAELNTTLSMFNKINHSDNEFLDAFISEQKIRLFDLRELWIRVMGDCRYECQRRNESDQD